MKAVMVVEVAEEMQEAVEVVVRLVAAWAD